MSIVIKLSETRVKVQGSVSSANAAIFEEELFSAISGQDLTIDAENLTYISSAGLRVLLKAKKKLGGQLVVENVNLEVFEILDMTGFTQILTVQTGIPVTPPPCRRYPLAGGGMSPSYPVCRILFI